MKTREVTLKYSPAAPTPAERFRIVEVRTGSDHEQPVDGVLRVPIAPRDVIRFTLDLDEATRAAFPGSRLKITIDPVQQLTVANAKDEVDDADAQGEEGQAAAVVVTQGTPTDTLRVRVRRIAGFEQLRSAARVAHDNGVPAARIHRFECELLNAAGVTIASSVSGGEMVPDRG